MRAKLSEGAGLEQLTALPGVTHALLVQSDGLLIAQRSAESTVVQEELQTALIRVAAMTATALSLNKRIVGALGGGSLTEATITGTEGKITLYAVGTRALLALVSEKDADAQPIAQGVEEILGLLAAERQG